MGADAPARSPRLELLGADFDTYPYLSGYGLLLRLCRLMALERRELMASFGLRLRKDLDLLLQLQRTGRAQIALCTAVGIDPAYASTYWRPESWSPLQTGGALDREAPVRQCPECARHGYHTAAFQLPSIVECPWHAQRLIETCPRCSRPLFLRLDSPEQMGCCPCGFDLFDADTASAQMRRFPTVHARGWLEAYWRWAREQRVTRFLIAQDHTSHWRGLYRVQASPPNAPLADSCIEVDDFAASGIAEPPARECWAWSLLGSERPMTFAPLPARVHAMLRQVTRDVAQGLPETVATPLELVTLHGFDAGVGLGENLDVRPEGFITPHGCSDSHEIWLNLSAIEPEMLQLCGRLIDRVIAACGVQLDLAAKSLQAARGHALTQITGRHCLVRALECLIRRGYAQGLDTVLRAYLRQQTRPGTCWWMPSIEVRARQGHLDRIRIAWLQVPAPRLRRIADIPLTIPQPRTTSASRQHHRAKPSRSIPPSRRGCRLGRPKKT